MDESLEKWERWLEQSLRLDTGYPKIRVRVVTSLEEDAVVRQIGDVFDVEVYAPIRNQSDRFKAAYDSVLRAIITRAAKDPNTDPASESLSSQPLDRSHNVAMEVRGLRVSR